MNALVAGPVSISRGQLRVVRSQDFLNKDCAVGELFVPTVILNCSWRGIGEVHLVALRINDVIYAEHLIPITIIVRLADVSILLDEIESAKGIFALCFRVLKTDECDE